MNSETKLKKPKRKLFYNFVYDFVKATGAVPALLCLRPKFHYPFGKPVKKGPVLVAANHYSYWDPVSVLLTFPFHRVHLLATSVLFDKKVKKFFFTQMHCIEVNRENFHVSSFRTVVERLGEGRIIAIFPEGKISKEEENPEAFAFKSGVVLMAHRANAPVLPIYLSNRTKWYHRQHIVVGMPIQITEILGKIPSMQRVGEITDLLQEKEEELRTYLETKQHLKKQRKNGKGNEVNE